MIKNNTISFSDRLRVVKNAGRKEAYNNVLEYMLKILKGDQK